jgi:itaconyl-CoA hydratase
MEKEKESAGAEQKERVMAGDGGGPFYEDFEVGRKLAHEGGRTITDSDNIWFSLLTCNANEIHFNKDYAEKYFSRPPFNGRLVVNSALVFAIVLGLSAKDTSRNGIMLGMSEWRVSNPTFAGDTIYSESEVVDKRESKSHPTMGLVTITTRGFNQTGETVLTYSRTFMVRKAGREWT